jgi:hypothetical protein
MPIFRQFRRMLIFRPSMSSLRSPKSNTYKWRCDCKCCCGNWSGDDAQDREGLRWAQHNDSTNRTTAGGTLAGLAGADNEERTGNRSGSAGSNNGRCGSRSFSRKLPQQSCVFGPLLALHRRLDRKRARGRLKNILSGETRHEQSHTRNSPDTIC